MTGLNVLLLTADDMNGDTPGCCGGAAEATPRIDALARDGVLFRRAHVPVAICQPSRSVMLTGRYPHRNGAEGFEPIAHDVPVLTDVLHAAGYRCGILGKVTHLTPVERFGWAVQRDIDDLGVGRDPARYAGEAAAFIRTADDEGRPWFLMANAHDPHRPFHGSDQERQLFSPAQLAEVATPSHVFAAGDWPVPPFLPDLPDVRLEVAEYLSSCRRADDVVGAVLDAVEALGAADRTLVIFLSDNGMAFPFAKGNCYLHSTRTPLVVRLPGAATGVVDDTHFVTGADLMPTVCDVLGLPAPPDMDGRSFAPLLAGEQQPGRDSVVTVYHRGMLPRRFEMRAVQDSRYGYIWNAWAGGLPYRAESMSGRTWEAMERAADDDPFVGGRVAFCLRRTVEELYDLEADPGALHNLAADPEHRDLVEEKRAALRAWMTAKGDPLLERYAVEAAGPPVAEAPAGIGSGRGLLGLYRNRKQVAELLRLGKEMGGLDGMRRFGGVGSGDDVNGIRGLLRFARRVRAARRQPPS